jgi:CheY-like chemotaxis protein
MIENNWKNNYKCSVVDNGYDALEEKENFDLILMDINMPSMVWNYKTNSAQRNWYSYCNNNWNYRSTFSRESMTL